MKREQFMAFMGLEVASHRPWTVDFSWPDHSTVAAKLFITLLMLCSPQMVTFSHGYPPTVVDGTELKLMTKCYSRHVIVNAVLTLSHLIIPPHTEHLEDLGTLMMKLWLSMPITNGWVMLSLKDQLSQASKLYIMFCRVSNSNDWTNYTTNFLYWTHKKGQTPLRPELPPQNIVFKQRV